MAAIRTARERARTEVTAEILRAARDQLAEQGAAGLSLRAVARELGMVSSALYRYFPSRDELLTALILEAYGSLADAGAAARARIGRADHRRRWLVTCRAVRRWALAHPHEYALIYGSPVPGYLAPKETIEPAARVMLLFADVVRDAVAAEALVAEPAQCEAPLPYRLEVQLRAVAQEFAGEVPEVVLARMFYGFSQLLGMISLELYGHFVGSLDPAEAFFDYAMSTTADLIGLPAA
ncbi:MAG: TetR/AcrR family transcriptional regulator [Actinomycetota bacterium]|nr:TetR/AcrR family transcriptional regulator [Actinomycetota bacterium]